MNGFAPYVAALEALAERALRGALTRGWPTPASETPTSCKAAAVEAVPALRLHPESTRGTAARGARRAAGWYDPTVSDAGRARAALDGECARELRRSVPLAARQKAGAFFTGRDLSARLWAGVSSGAAGVAPGEEAAQSAGGARFVHGAGPAGSTRVPPPLAAPAAGPRDGVCPESPETYLDPACGAGDLLLGAAQRLPRLPTLDATLDLWGAHLLGFDLEPLFVRAARARLVLAAAAAGVPAEHPRPLDELLPGVRQGDGLADGVAQRDALARATALVLNPPFTRAPAPKGCAWARGGVSAAAVFVAHYLAGARAGAHLAAILPDVLRTGTRYADWREAVGRAAHVTEVDVYGAFDPQADVDVFVLRGVVRGAVAGGVDAAGYQAAAGPPAAAWWPDAPPGAARLGDLFDVSVGAVVPHRHPGLGPWHPYLRAADAPAWGALHDWPHCRQFRGRVATPPFVVVRRTSSPADAARAIATVVTGDRPIAVENHLLVLTPRDGRLATCQAAQQVLRARSTTEWLNQRMRCRHLTVGVLGDLPWPTGAEA